MMVFYLLFEILYPLRIPDEFQGWLKKEFKHYSKENIFDYMDGSGEVYISFNFENLYVYNYEKEKNKIIVEIFEMVEPKYSFGLYTHIRGRGKTISAIGEDCEIFKNSLIFWKGKYFVSLISEDNIKNEILLSFAKEIEKNIKKEKFKSEIFKRAKELNLNLKNIKYFFNMNILNYNYYIINEDIFYFKDGTEGIFSPYKDGYILLLLFKNNKILNLSLKNLKEKFYGGDLKVKEIESGKWSGFILKENSIIIFLDFKSKEILEKKINEYR